MENVKKAYETPEVIKVKFDASDRITTSMCAYSAGAVESADSQCRDLT